MKKREKELVEELLSDWIVCFKDCFCDTSEERWIKMFANKRLETFLADKKDYIEEVTGLDLNNDKNLKEFRSMYKNMFLEIMTNHIQEVKERKIQEEKERKKRKWEQKEKIVSNKQLITYIYNITNDKVKKIEYKKEFKTPSTYNKRKVSKLI